MPNAIVTGASRGLGLGIACRLADAGHDVIAVARKPSDELSTAILERSGKAPACGALLFRPFDLNDVSGLHGFVTSLHHEFGSLDCLINNAGLGTPGVLATMPDESIEHLIHLNVVSSIVLTKYVVRAMMVSGGNRIVNIASIVASSGFRGLSVYSATKASLIGFTRSLAREVGSLGITVNAVAPGFVATEMTRELGPGHRTQIARRSALGRMALIDDVASAVEFLVSPAAANITGTVLTVDAGATA